MSGADDIDWSEIPLLLKLIYEERQARYLILENAQEGSPAHEQFQEWWTTVDALLQEIRVTDWNTLGHYEAALKEILGVLAGQARYLARGIVPAPITNVISPHAPPIGPAEERDIRTAVAFEKAAKDGAIKSRRPRDTICRLYGVTNSTLRGWIKKYGADCHYDISLVRLEVARAGKRYRLSNTRTNEGRRLNGSKARARKSTGAR